MSLSEASGELGSAVVDIVETSAAEDQDSVDILLATALKVSLPLYILYTKQAYTSKFSERFYWKVMTLF